MKRSYLIRFLTVLLVCLLLAPPWIGKVEAVSAAVSDTLKPISTIRSGNLAFELVDLNMIPSGSSNVVSFSIAFHNQSNAPLPLIDYWVRLQSKSGSNFNIQMSAKDKDVDTIAPNTKKIITFYSKVSSATRIQDLTIRLIQWDFNSPNYEKILGTFSIPAQYDDAVKAQGVKMYYISDILMHAKVTSATLSNTDVNHVVTLNLELTNNGKTNAVLPKYSFFILTSAGIMYPLETTDIKDNENLYPLITKKIALRGEVPRSIDTKGWQLVVTEYDDAFRSNVPVASFYIPAFTSGESLTVEIGGTKDLTINNMTVRTKVERFTRSKNDSNYVSTITFSFENLGTNPVTIPKYDFGIRTADGLTYPITAGSTQNISVNPKVKKEIKLSATVPSSVSEQGWSLVLYSPAAQDGTPLSGSTLAIYKLPDTGSRELTVGSSFEYTNENGQYMVKLDNVQRFPWDDQDILSAKLTIRNPAFQSKPVPVIEGHFLLDNTVEVPFQAIQMDNVIAIKGFTTVSYTLYGKIPYTYDYSTLKVVLKEKSEDNTPVDMVEFVTNSNVQQLKTIPVSGSHRIEGAGRRAEVSIRDVRTYSGVDSDIYTVIVDITNMEKRYANIAQLVGYFRSKNDLMFPVTITQITEKVSPMSIASVYMYAVLPKGFDVTDMELILGEAVNNNQFIVSGQANAYVNPVSFTLPIEDTTPKQDFTDLVLFPYTISISNFRATIMTADSINLSFHYTMGKNNFVKTSSLEHQLVLEFRDVLGDISFTRTFTLDKGQGEYNLSLGEHTMNIEITDPFVLLKLQSLKTFNIKVYDQFMDQKKLLAEREFTWF